MKVIGTKIIQLADLTESLFVRTSLNHDHVLALAELIESGVKMKTSIEITDKNVMVDGRHRREAYGLNNITEVEAKVLSFDNDAEMIAYAYRSNTGGSLPPSRGDTEHTVRLLLDRKVAKKYIAEVLGLPNEVAMKYVNIVQSKFARQKLLQAAAAVVDDNMTAPKAAEQHGVDLDQLKQLLSGHKKKGKPCAAQKKAEISKTYRSFAAKQAQAVKWLLEKFDEGDVSESQVKEVIESIEGMQKRWVNSIRDWKARLEAKIRTGGGALQ